MKHAGEQALKDLDETLRALRQIPAITERSPGVFYRKSRAFLHFHEDPSGMYADVRLDELGDFERRRVTTKLERRQLLRAVQIATSR